MTPGHRCKSKRTTGRERARETDSRREGNKTLREESGDLISKSQDRRKKKVGGLEREEQSEKVEQCVRMAGLLARREMAS